MGKTTAPKTRPEPFLLVPGGLGCGHGSATLASSSAPLSKSPVKGWWWACLWSVLRVQRRELSPSLSTEQNKETKDRGWNRQGREAGCQLWFSSFSQWGSALGPALPIPRPELVLFVSLCCLSDECQQEKVLVKSGTFSPLQIFLINRKSNIRVYRSWYFFPQ